MPTDPPSGPPTRKPRPEPPLPGEALQDTDVIVLGAGPAGVPAAVAAAHAGASVVVIDAADRPGGQFHRQFPSEFDVDRPGALHHGWRDAAAGFAALARDERIRHVAGSRVWLAESGEDGLRVHTVGRHPATFRARALVLATGAVERALPFPGWDLPGVLTVGAAQSLVKGQGVRPGHRVVVAGTGPLLLASASTLVRSGTRIIEVVDANGPRTWRSGGRHALDPAKAVEAAGYVQDLARSRTPYRPHHAVVAARGEGRVEDVIVAEVDDGWNIVPGTHRALDVDAVCVSYGFSPNVGVGASLGCTLSTDVPPALLVDRRQRTSVPGVLAAGEVTGVAGAKVAGLEGAVAGAAAAHGCGYDVDRARVGADARHRDRKRRFAAALERATPIRDGWIGWLADDTIVCRCEEVTYGQVRKAIIDSHARDVRSVKMTTRCGMGRCQAAVCGPTVVDLVASTTGVPVADATGLAHRSIAEPVTLGEISTAVGNQPVQ